MIKEANFWGEKYVISGSDCGHIFFWERESGECVHIIPADNHVVNCVQPHPTHPLLASSGIDYSIKLWAPLNQDSLVDHQYTTEVRLSNLYYLSP